MSTHVRPLDGRHIWTSRDEGFDWWLLCHLAGLCRVIARWCDGQTESRMLRTARSKESVTVRMCLGKDALL